MSKDAVELKGFDDINRILDALPKALGPKVVRKCLRDGVKPLIAAARANTPQDTGNLKKSIGVINGKKKQAGAIIVGPRRGKGKTSDGWHAHFFEYGVTPRIVKKPTKGHYKKGTVLGPIEAKPFMRPAWDTTKDIVRMEIARSLREVLDSNFKGVFK
jgi:HK97 gp10 family phage protein